MRKSGRLCLILAACSVFVTGVSGSVYAKGGTLKVGVRDDIMRMSYLNPNTGKYYGMEADFAAAVAKELGYDGVEYVTVIPENRKEKLLNGEIDCLIASYSMEGTRLENFDFSPVYYEDHAVIMVEKSSMFTGIEDIIGRKVGVMEGANTGPKLYGKLLDMGLLTEDDTKGSELVQMESYSALSVALEEGSVDAVCMDGSMANTFMDDDRILIEENISDEHYAVATQKDSELSPKMAQAVQKLLDDGTVAGLLDKWD